MLLQYKKYIFFSIIFTNLKEFDCQYGRLLWQIEIKIIIFCCLLQLKYSMSTKGTTCKTSVFGVFSSQNFARPLQFISVVVATKK